MDKFEAFDPALKELMGSRYQEQPAKKAAVKPAKPVEVQMEDPIPNEYTWLKACIKRSWIYCAVSLLVFYWQQTGLMDSAAAVPTMYACALLFGWTVGRCATGRR